MPVHVIYIRDPSDRIDTNGYIYQTYAYNHVCTAMSLTCSKIHDLLVHQLIRQMSGLEEVQHAPHVAA